MSSAATIDVTSLPMCIEQVLLRIATVFVYGHIEGVGVTAYPVVRNVKLKRWGQMLRIIGNS